MPACPLGFLYVARGAPGCPSLFPLFPCIHPSVSPSAFCICLSLSLSLCLCLSPLRPNACVVPQDRRLYCTQSVCAGSVVGVCLSRFASPDPSVSVFGPRPWLASCSLHEPRSCQCSRLALSFFALYTRSRALLSSLCRTNPQILCGLLDPFFRFPFPSCSLSRADLLPYHHHLPISPSISLSPFTVVLQPSLVLFLIQFYALSHRFLLLSLSRTITPFAFRLHIFSCTRRHLSNLETQPPPLQPFYFAYRISTPAILASSTARVQPSCSKPVLARPSPRSHTSEPGLVAGDETRSHPHRPSACVINTHDSRVA